MISSVSAVLANSFGARLRPCSFLAVPALVARALRALRSLAAEALLNPPVQLRSLGALGILAAAFVLGVLWVVVGGHGSVPRG